MNFENLIDGTYTIREICECIGREVPRGKAQQLLLQQLEEYFSIEKIGEGRGTKYILVAKAKRRRKGNKKNMFTKVIKKNVLDNNNIYIYNTKKMISLVNKTETEIITEEEQIKQTFNIIPLYEQWVNNCFQKLFIPNYKELCKAIDMNYCTNTNAKNKQLEEFSMYVDFEKGVNKKGEKGRGYMVNKINSTEYIPLEKNYKYYNDIRNMFLLYFHEGNTEENFFKKDLLTLIDICNPIYFENKERVLEHAKELNLPIKTVRDFFNITDKKLSNIILGNLNKMYNEHYLSKFEKSYKVRVINEEEKIEYRIATEEEIIEIQYALYKATKEFNNPKFVKGFGDKKEITFTFERENIYQIPNLNIKEFTEYVMKLLNKTCPNIIAYYPCYLIKFNYRVCNDYLQHHNLNEMNSNNLNEVFFNSLMRTFEKNSINAINGNVPKSAEKFTNNRKKKEHYETLADTNIKK